ncbi:MAG: hypothetical protein JRH16_01275 [Deltaproteobacteria bacterium]|nr:hypothetical protein [Deltaproteobacteria bacterium]
MDKHTLEEWSPPMQLRMMGEAKAALDIKGGDFGQSHKPPTKIHQFVYAGLPPAINVSCNSYDYLCAQGLPVCRPEEVDRWLSRAYWEEVNSFAERLKEVISLERVGQRYREILLGAD